MQEIYEVVKLNKLFENITYEEFEIIYNCLGCHVESYNAKQLIFQQGDIVNEIGIVLSGSILLHKQASDGSVAILSELNISDMFGEVFVCGQIKQIPLDVIATEDTTILYINIYKLFAKDEMLCQYNHQLIINLLRIISQKNLFLNKKIDILSSKTIRDKLMKFLEYAANGSKIFEIDYNREELAAFIASDRSAMCAELSKMQKEGLIKYHKNHFEILR